MTAPKLVRLGAQAGLLLSFLPATLVAQGRGLEFGYGRWWHGEPATTFSLAWHRPFLGPIDYTLGLVHLDDSRALDDRTATGGEVTVGLGRDGSGPYLVAGSALTMRHRDRNVDAAWSAGGGYALRVLPFLSLGIEARYQWEDRNVRGFWRLARSDRRGFAVQGRASLAFAAARRPAPTGGGRPVPIFEAPEEAEVYSTARREGASEEAARTAADVVQTAVEAMGTPYRWGGSDENGYDCSGLIQYAYEEHGILLPRVSKDQVRIGLLLDKRVGDLRPGDVLGFATNGSGVSHVGLYVGDGRFIHSAQSGVKISSLMTSDADSRYWRDRWVVARRILN